MENCKTERDKALQQVEAVKYDSKVIHNKQKVEIVQLQEQQKACLQQSDGLRRECQTLMEMEIKLKRDKQVLTEKLESAHKEKMVSEMASTKEGSTTQRGHSTAGARERGVVSGDGGLAKGLRRPQRQDHAENGPDGCS